MTYTVGLMGVYVEIKLKNYLKLIILCGQERNSQEKKNNKLVQASDFELHMFFEYCFLFLWWSQFMLISQTQLWRCIPETKK